MQCRYFCNLQRLSCINTGVLGTCGLVRPGRRWPVPPTSSPRRVKNKAQCLMMNAVQGCGPPVETT